MDQTAQVVNGRQPTTKAHRYLVTGSDTLHTPAVQRHQPIDLVTPHEAEAVYIAPAAFHAALAPLLAHRRAQGSTVALIDVAEISDVWSYGEVDPATIRRFMQHAAATWPRSPEALVLVGDGTSDLHNYLGRNNTNHIPPYLAMVDPWLGETACEPWTPRLSHYSLITLKERTLSCVSLDQRPNRPLVT